MSNDLPCKFSTETQQKTPSFPGMISLLLGEKVSGAPIFV